MWVQNKYFFGTVEETTLARSLVPSVAQASSQVNSKWPTQTLWCKSYSSVLGHQKQLLCFLSERRQFCCTAYNGQTVKSAQLSLKATY